MGEREHEALIATLAGQLRPVRRLWSPWLRTSLWLAACAVVAVLLGASDGLAALSHRLSAGCSEVVELIGIVFTAVCAAFAAFALSVPGRSTNWALLPVLPLLLWIGASGWGCASGIPAGDPAALPAPQSCIKFIVLVSLPLSGSLFLMLRRAFSVRPVLTATMAGLAAAAAAAALLDFEHPVDTTVEDLLAHLTAILVVIMLNRFLSGPALRRLTLVLAGVMLAQPGHAQQRRPVVVELFTSQGCSSCPPADALLSELAQRRPDILPLAFHVDYWNRLGWTDRFSAPEFTARQRRHAAEMDDQTVYTPELVVEGTNGVVGSDRAVVEAAIRDAKAKAVTAAAVTVRSITTGELEITVGPGAGRASVVLVGYDPSHTTSIGRGENGGRTLQESNIVRSAQTVGVWSGTPLVLRHTIPDGQVAAVLLEREDGRIVGAATAAR